MEQWSATIIDGMLKSPSTHNFSILIYRDKICSYNRENITTKYLKKVDKVQYN